MKISNKEIINLLKHCVNPDRTALTNKNYKTEIVKPLSEIDTDISFYCVTGSTKICLIPMDKENNFVIKIPFTGYYYGKENYAEFAFDDGERTWFPGNYCDIEAERCKDFIKAGWGDLIAKTALIGIVGDIFIYKQEKVSEILEDNTSFSLPSCNYDDDFMDKRWSEILRNYIGDQSTNKFLTFLEENGIDDLHSGNLGFIGDRPVLFDYSSFAD